MISLTFSAIRSFVPHLKSLVYTQNMEPSEKQTNTDERQYLDLVQRILTSGVLRDNRTGVSTKALFGQTMRFDLRNNIIPVLTTKRVAWKSVVEELVWFLRGRTDAKELQARGIKIWDAWGTPEYLKSIGIEGREPGDLGPIYGFQWRHFGAKYVDCHTDYTGQGVDQLRNLIKGLIANPNDRRMILSAWNPMDLEQMALPPCHMISQFICANGELTCILDQRSGDMGLGIPFNIASYALLTHILASVCGLRARELVHMIGDAHIYQNHEDPLRRQLRNEPRAFPKLSLPMGLDAGGLALTMAQRVVRAMELIEGLDKRTGEISLDDYNPHPTISMPVAV